MTGKPAIGAFFDLDLTILTINSGSLWMKRDLRDGRLSLAQYGQALTKLVRYRLGNLDVEQATRQWLRATLAGRREQDERERIRSWYLDQVDDKVSPLARQAIEHHRRRGDTLILITSSSAYQAEIAAERLGLDHWLSSKYAVADGLFTGEIVEPLCYGPGKVHYAESLSGALGISLDQSVFYSDSITDLPLLERVGHPKVVNPDGKLERIAQARKWPIFHWR